MVNDPLHGEMASACFHRSFALLALNFRTSLPEMSFEYPAMVGDVKSLAGVRVFWKIVLVIVGRSMAYEIAWRRSAPSLPEKCGRFCGMVNDWNTADGWLKERSPRSDSYVVSALVGTCSRMSREPESRSLYAASEVS